ncbi:electron transfer flavoprotein subunit alpha/FixB family protein [Pelotomaculum propionicicum]|uniref:Caffeyl-CoA reductase-Etf complex subunit CarE n=1 Tax=Pelotomaculum propionicicum TaxID=258475 RepID=A0A4Y7RCF5_9FIRM|nr:electron transfer flavoprotein subunit alpha/FixB family protein [Pelotomaculum propionicicum]TEB06410.1 Caffeyl-CoA reductase-Etf complex subunit CarE [Pelotomaculum propionicicum]
MAGVWILAESREPTLELLSAGIDIAAQLGVKVAAFALSSQLAEEYIKCGCDEVMLLPPLAAGQPLESYVPVIVEEALLNGPDIILIGASQRGREIAARAAAALNTGLCSGCTGLRLDQEKKQLVMERMLFGGAAVQTVVCETRPQMATIPPRTFEQAQPAEGHQGEVRQLPAAPPSPVTVVERTPKTSEAVDITEAKTVVCVGRGVGKQEDIALARELAGVLGGEVGCSRPVAEDLRWLPEELYLGISGKKVKPDLYIGVGVAGQIQHVSGIRDSKVIVGINRDENAPIFEAADYGIVGDLYDIVPKLVKEIKAALKI